MSTFVVSSYATTLSCWEPKSEEIMSKKMENQLRNYQSELDKMKELGKKTIHLGKSIKYHKMVIHELGFGVKRAQ